MSDATRADTHSWLVEPLEANVAQAVERLARAPDVRRIAVMPDVHLASDVCVGTVLATSRLLYPQAVGGDIGCGVLALPLGADAGRLADPATAGRVLASIARAVPAARRSRRNALPWPDTLDGLPLSHPTLRDAANDVARLQLGTLGGGNHFVELQADDEDRLWLLIHSGSRGMGQTIRDHHVARACPAGSGLVTLDAEAREGVAYLRDAAWARAYADVNRRAMASAVLEVLGEPLAISPRADAAISLDHNHVARERHGGEELWVHRKGAMPAGDGVPGVLPGSMGTPTYHVAGRGCAAALGSSPHGAGRALSRTAARERLTVSRLRQQMAGVWYDCRMDRALIEEAPAAYKDVRAVLRAARDLIKVTRTLRPVLNYKGR